VLFIFGAPISPAFLVVADIKRAERVVQPRERRDVCQPALCRPILLRDGSFQESRMAGRVLNRRALRDDVAAGPIDEEEEENEAEPAEKVRKPRARKAAPKVAGPAKPRARKKSVKAQPIMFARWAVCDGGLKRLAMFDYKDRAGADAKLTRLQEEKKGPFVLQLVKEACAPAPAAPEPAPAP
jgi:hypothetical protein